MMVPRLFSLALLMFIPSLAHTSSIEESDQLWFKNLDISKPKLTRLHFYFHDVVSGPGQTTFMVVPPPKTIKQTSTTLFGQVNMFDNPLTKAPELTSDLVGRAQGQYSFSSQEELSLLMGLTFVFTSGKHNGSTVTVLGRNPVFQSRRELPIVGGTGDFRLGRGFASVSAYFVNVTVSIMEYNVTVIHF